MKQSNTVFDNVYQQLSDWFTSFEQHEITSVVTIVEQAKKYLLAAESIPEEKVKQFTDNLSYDLNQFYKQYQEDAENSLMIGLLEEKFWQSLSQITDRSQVEWAEMDEDFNHHGIYKTGDMIGFGLLQCKHCRHEMNFYHLSSVPKCPVCGKESFKRLPLAP